MGKVIKKAVGFIVAIGTTVAGIVTANPALIRLGIGLAVTQVVGLFRKNPSISGFGDQLTLKKNQVAPRPIAYGETATGGVLVYQEGFGENNKTVSTVIVLAGHEIEGIEKFRWGEETFVTFTNSNADGDFHDLMFLFEHRGGDGQTADADLAASSAVWTSDHRLRGIAYVHLKLVFDPEKFDKGFLEPRFVFKGRKVYNPRKDSTNGGSGGHRLDDPATWEWSDNPVLCTVDYLRGIRVDGTLIAGMGIADGRIDWANIIAEANVCDELVGLKGGGQIKRYTCNGIIDPSRPHRQNLEALISSMAGTVVFQGGVWRVYAGVPRPALISRNTDDVVGGLRLKAKKGISEKVNSIRGVYMDADADFEPKDYQPRQNAVHIAEDGGLELWFDLDLPMTTSGPMAQRISKIMLERARLERQLDLTFFPVALQDQAMDAITFTYETFNIESQKFLIADWSLTFERDANGNTGFLVNETLIEENDAIYAWDPEADELDIGASPKAATGKRLTDQRALAPVNVAGGLVSVDPNPLSASDNGASARIDVAEHQRHYGFGTVTYNSGSILGLAFETLYYVYADDPLLEGGNVSYFATTNKTDVTDSNNRIYIGQITTPANGGGSTSGGGGGGLLGGGGAQ